MNDKVENTEIQMFNRRSTLNPKIDNIPSSVRNNETQAEIELVLNQIMPPKVHSKSPNYDFTIGS